MARICRDSYKTISLSDRSDFDAAFLEKLEALTPEEREIFFLALEQQEMEADLAALEYDREIVDIETWLDDPYFMGEVTKSIYPQWRDDLIEMFGTNLYHTALISGSTGTGKSFFSHLVILRMVYEASCLKDPAKSYGLATGSALCFCNIASSKETARRVVFEGVQSKMTESPYFREEFKPKRTTKEEIIFPKNLQIIAGSSTDTSIIGSNIFGGIMDEGNFVKTGVSNTQMLSSQARFKNYQKAMRLYTSITRRMKSRFNQKGKLPGILCVLSSKTTTDSFTEQIVNKALADGDKYMFIRDRSLIDVKRDHFSKETFKVLVGNESFVSRILAPDEDVSAYGRTALVVDVPEDLRKDFEDGMEEALRDLLGISTMAISSFMSRVDLIESMKDHSRGHPFTCALMPDPREWDSRLPYRVHWQRLARQTANGEWTPILHPDKPRVVHMDPGSTGDAFGLAIGCISHYLPLTDDGEVVEMVPQFHIDFVLRIKGEPGNEVLFKNVRKLLYEFAAHGFHISLFTSDTYQSREMLQAIQDQGYKAEVLSVDTSKEPYRFFRSAIYDGRVKCYDYPVLFQEVKGLEENSLKVDHRPGNSKDVSDAVCGVIWNLLKMAGDQQPVLPVKGISVAADGRRAIPVSSDPFEEKERKEREQETTDEKAASMGPQRVWKKNEPKSIPPTYKKRKVDGSVEVVNGGIFDPEDYVIRG